MTEHDSGPAAQWPPAAIAEGMQELTEQSADAQAELYNQFVSAASGGAAGGLTPGGGAWGNTAAFKARVQSNGRLSIPDAEREALDIEEGDIVQTIVIPVKRNRSE